MASVTLSTKGQLVLPKPVRDALRLKPGHRLSIAVEGRRIVIEAEQGASTAGWQPLNPVGARLSTSDLCRPVKLQREVRRR